MLRRGQADCSEHAAPSAALNLRAAPICCTEVTCYADHAADHTAPITLRRAGCAEQAAPSRLRRAGCAEHAAPSTLRRARCAEHAAPSTLRRAGCAEHAAALKLAAQQLNMTLRRNPLARARPGAREEENPRDGWRGMSSSAA
eukprot:CAMPEP_0179853000 /NCGR_PEP_ID=MMETSP0982-20121206/9114_1 /TAXON_ID=483367 /ORGANISM="non described non described, Strain CCMP 2436" /LENGTH=142 /DNA_ID=CAMNT_0021738685 /DNA_START=81 /DNA_END=510 /DNA_ORIENTATION=+